jgi:hypothetical protein
MKPERVSHDQFIIKNNDRGLENNKNKRAKVQNCN